MDNPPVGAACSREYLIATGCRSYGGLVAARRRSYDLVARNFRIDDLPTMKPTIDAPEEIRVLKSSRALRVAFSDEETYTLPFEYLRVYSPSAEVRGHGPGQEVLQMNKEDVGITAIEPVGHYAIRIIFSDKHSTGLYTWAFLRDLGRNQAHNWADYLDRLSAAGYPRSTDS